MASRAAMLLAREQHRLERAGPLKGISYYLVKNNIFHWHITLQGLADSAWESGIFQLEMHFDESYSDTPPQVFFLSVPFHPNIDMNSGRPCLAILDATNAWHPLITIQSLLLHLQALLSEPELQDAANPAAAEIFVRAPHLYAQLVRDSVVASRRLASGLPLFDEPPIDFEPARAESLPPLPAERDSNHHRARKTIELSFEAYHRDWKSLATSIPVIPDGSDSPEISKALRQLALGGVSSRDKVTEDQLKETLQRQHLLWYGSFKHSKTHAPRGRQADAKAELRRERIESMKRIYSLRNALDAQQQANHAAGAAAEIPAAPPASDSAAQRFLESGGSSANNGKDSTDSRQRAGGPRASTGLRSTDGSGLGDAGSFVRDKGSRGANPTSGIAANEASRPPRGAGAARAGSPSSTQSSLSQKQLGSVASSSSLTNSTRLWTGASSGIERTESRPTTGHHSNWEAEADDLVEWSRDLPDDT